MTNALHVLRLLETAGLGNGNVEYPDNGDSAVMTFKSVQGEYDSELNLEWMADDDVLQVDIADYGKDDVVLPWVMDTDDAVLTARYIAAVLVGLNLHRNLDDGQKQAIDLEVLTEAMRQEICDKEGI